MTALDEFAPYPTREEDVTAEGLARHFAVRAHARCSQIDELLNDDSDAGKRLYVMATGVLVHEYGLQRTLRALARLDPEHADEVALSIWRDWEDGAIGEALWETLVCAYGIDPDEVTEAARKTRDETETTPKEPTHA